MKYYYALFKQTEEAVEVEFPDLAGCATFGKDWEEALVNATDALAAWMANAEAQFIKAPSEHDQLLNLKGQLVPIALDEQTIESYQQLKRFNVIFPMSTLKEIDRFREKMGLKRSTFLQKAAEEYLRNHEIRN